MAQDQGSFAYCLQDDNNPDNPSLLGEYAIFDEFVGAHFSIQCRARSAEDVALSNRPDVALVYEFRNDQNYSYVVFNKDKNFTRIAKVVDGVRTVLATADGSVPVLQDDDYRILKVTRKLKRNLDFWNTIENRIEVFYDGNLVMTAQDPEPLPGRYGVGSKNDRAYFDMVDVNDICGQDIAVPVELTAFRATAREERVQLLWETASESNNFGFEVERRIETGVVDLTAGGKPSPAANPAWEWIAFVKGHGTTNEANFYTFTDKLEGISPVAATDIKYRLKQIDLDGTFEYHGPIEVLVGQAPRKIVLAQNYPNPFNPGTTIEFAIPESGHTTVKIFNVRGQEVHTLVDAELQVGVAYKVTFESSTLESGVYYYSVRTRDFFRSKKMILIK